MKNDVNSERSSMSSVIESDAIPFVNSPSEESSSSSSSSNSSLIEDLPPVNGIHHSSDDDDDANSYVVTHPDGDEESLQFINNHVSPEESIQIATVETRTVRVEEVVIPQDENAVCCVICVSFVYNVK